MPVGTSATSLLLTGATLPDDVLRPPPPLGTPYFTVLFILGSAEPRSSTLTDFGRHITNFRGLGSAKPTIPGNAHLCCARSL